MNTPTLDFIIIIGLSSVSVRSISYTKHQRSMYLDTVTHLYVHIIYKNKT